MKKSQAMGFPVFLIFLWLTACGGTSTGDLADLDAKGIDSGTGDTTGETNNQTSSEAFIDSDTEETALPYPFAIVDTHQTNCYNSRGAIINCPAPDQPFYGQDAQHAGHPSSYTDNGDGTVTDNITGLMWQKSPDINGDHLIDAADKMTFGDAVAAAESLSFAGYSDWRLPTVKELYSLIDFRGTDPSGIDGYDTSDLVPFIDTEYFDFGYGDTSAGDRLIDAQFASASLYVSTTMNGNRTMFGVNFADGRIKGYPTDAMAGQTQGKGFYVLYVRDNPDYGKNVFHDNGDATISDLATGFMWSQFDSGYGMNWESSFAWVEQKNRENYLGYSDWRLPDIKELQSLVDYSRSPDTTASPAINPLFHSTAIINEAGQTDFPWFWSSTTHGNQPDYPSEKACYLAFGRAMGYMFGEWIDVHGAGAQRSDPKTGSAADYPVGHGPQGDAIRIENFVRLVRDI